MKINSLFFKFEDLRNESGRGNVIGPGKRIFNHVTPDQNKILRRKFLEIFLVNIPKGTLMILLTKCVDFLTAGSIIRGLEAGKRAFRLHRLEKHTVNETVHRFAKEFFAAKCVCTSLVKDIVKIATYPLCILGLQFAALVGMASPLDGLVFTCILEEMWDQDIHKRVGNGGITLIPQKVMQLLFRSEQTQAAQISKSHCFYMAPCMQSQQTWQEKNIYRIGFPDYNPQTLRSLKLQFSNLVKESTPYLSSKDIALCNESITTWSNTIGQISPSRGERDETAANGDLLETAKTGPIKALRDTMLKSVNLLEKVVRLTDKALEKDMKNLALACPKTLNKLRATVSS